MTNQTDLQTAEVLKAIDEYLDTPDNAEEIITRLGKELGVTGTAAVFRESLRLAKEAAAQSRAQAPDKPGEREGLERLTFSSQHDRDKLGRMVTSDSDGETLARVQTDACLLHAALGTGPTKGFMPDTIAGVRAALAHQPNGTEASRGVGAKEVTKWLEARIEAAHRDSEAHPEGSGNRSFYFGQAIAYENALSLVVGEGK